MYVDQYAYQVPPNGVASSVRTAQDAGVDGWFVAESNQDPFVACTLAAAFSERVTIGTSVALAFTRTPMSLAYLAHGLQQASDGRFVLGLGSQVRAHIERRFSMPWSRPSARMEEFVTAFHAIWDSWESGEPLSFEGEFYRHTLMPDAFRPTGAPWPRPPLWLAGVGERMVAVAGRVADGLVCHPLSGPSYVAEVLAPAMRSAASVAGAAPGSRTVSANVMVATGGNDAEIAAAITQARHQVAFYASTAAYLPVLRHYGLEELHHEARALVAQGRWPELSALVDDATLTTFVVVAAPDEVGSAVRAAYHGCDADRLTLNTRHAFSVDEWKSVLGDLHDADAALAPRSA